MKSSRPYLHITKQAECTLQKHKLLSSAVRAASQDLVAARADQRGVHTGVCLDFVSLHVFI